MKVPVASLILVLAIVAGWRLVMLAHVPALDRDLRAARQAVIDWIDQGPTLDRDSLPDNLQELGIDSIQFEQFQPQALVFMQPGPDGQPGEAGVDDNGNGIIDDKSELGATRTDDVLNVTAGQIESDRPTLVLQRGAFVPVSRQAALRGDQPWHAVVRGHSSGETWSFVLPSTSEKRPGW
jgi:hypothetical protein